MHVFEALHFVFSLILNTIQYHDCFELVLESLGKNIDADFG